MDDFVAKFRNVRVVRDHDQRLLLLPQDVDDHVHDLVGGVAVEVARRLIRKHDLRVCHQSARDADALLLSAGELTRLVVHVRLEPHEVEHALGALDALRLRHAAERKRQRYVFQRGVIRHEVKRLKDEPDPLLPKQDQLALRHAL